MNKAYISEFKKLTKKCETVQKHIGLERDKLQSYYDELGDIIDSLDGGQCDLEHGLILIRDALDSMSQYL